MTYSVSYYDKNADSFFERTAYRDMSSAYNKFLPLIPKTGHILDAGCGVGRDGKHFKQQGYTVTLFDASSSMVEKAQKHVGQEVLKLTFEDLDFQEEFDGVWACASLLHVPYDSMQNALQNIHKALKPNGIFYASYKRGESDMVVGDRHFYNMNEEKITPYLSSLFEIIELWSNADGVSQVAPSPEKQWFNLLCRKKA
jgi:2-polyprenyl-3-methyl-5-hydroxy-6-metoxy-1,4-benzoquinol methylase